MPRRKSGRRANNEGNIYYRKSTRTFEAKVSLGRNPLTGKVDRRTVTAKTRAEVLDKMQELQASRRFGMLADARGWTFGAYLQRWLDHKKQTGARATTLQSYQYALNRLAPLFNWPLDEVGPYEVDMVFGDLLKKGLSPTYVAAIRTRLISAIEQATNWDLVARNWAKRTTAIKAERRKPRAWTPAEALRFIEAARDHRLEALYFLGLITGMRRGELLGLHWSDIEFAADGTHATIHVRRNVVEPGNELLVHEPKTENSVRTVVILDDGVDRLQRHRQRQLTEMAVGGPWEDPDIVFASEVGTYIRPRNLYRSFKALVAAAKVPDYGLHGMRSTHASMEYLRGVDERVISDRLGHSDVAFTRRTYQHLYPEQERGGAFRLSELAGFVKQERDNLN